MITREQVADLQPGDVVEFRAHDDPDVFTRGPVSILGDSGIRLGSHLVLLYSGGNGVGEFESQGTLTVISRVPRALYVNHDREKPAPGDVVRNADDDTDRRIWVSDGLDGGHLWGSLPEMEHTERSAMPKRLRLLVDGETGQVPK